MFRALVLIAVFAFASPLSAQLPPMQPGEVLVTAYNLGLCIGAAQPRPYGFNFYQPNGATVADVRPSAWMVGDTAGNEILTSYSPVLRQFIVLQQSVLQRVTGSRTFETLSTITPSTPLALSLNAQGEMYAIVLRGSSPLLLKFSANGVLLQTSALPSRFAQAVSMDLAQDGCTAIIALAGSATIARHNVCTNTTLPDIASALPLPATEVRYLPNGDLLVANPQALIELNQAGSVVRTYATPPAGGSNMKFAFDPTGTTVWVARSLGCGGFPVQLLHLDLVTGNVLSTTTPEDAENVARSVSVLGEWRAAIAGAAAAAAVPLFSNLMFGALATIIAIIAMTRLRL